MYESYTHISRYEISGYKPNIFTLNLWKINYKAIAKNALDLEISALKNLKLLKNLNRVEA